MHGLGAWILANTQWQYTKLYEGLLFLDLWSIHHMWSGLILFAALAHLQPRSRWATLLALLAAYEMLELIFIYVAFGAFRPETLKDQVTDIAVGMFGGLVGSRFMHQLRRAKKAVGGHRPQLRRFGIALTAVTIAFLWVGSYGYRYDVPALNSPGLNWWAFILWSLGLALQLQLYTALARRCAPLLALACSWLAHLAGLLLIEYVGYQLLGIREVGHPGRRALVGEMIHGTQSLFAFYLTAPAIATACHELIHSLFRSALERELEPIVRAPAAQPIPAGSTAAAVAD